MTALDVALAILGIGITALVVAGMVLIEPHHLVSPAVQTDLSDVKLQHPAGRDRRAKSATQPVAEQLRDPEDTLRASPDDGLAPAADRGLQPRDRPREPPPNTRLAPSE